MYVMVHGISRFFFFFPHVRFMKQTIHVPLDTVQAFVIARLQKQ